MDWQKWVAWGVLAVIIDVGILTYFALRHGDKPKNHKK